MEPAGPSEVGGRIDKDPFLDNFVVLLVSVYVETFVGGPLWHALHWMEQISLAICVLYLFALICVVVSLTARLCKHFSKPHRQVGKRTRKRVNRCSPALMVRARLQQQALHRFLHRWFRVAHHMSRLHEQMPGLPSPVEILCLRYLAGPQIKFDLGCLALETLYRVSTDEHAASYLACRCLSAALGYIFGGPCAAAVGFLWPAFPPQTQGAKTASTPAKPAREHPPAGDMPNGGGGVDADDASSAKRLKLYGSLSPVHHLRGRTADGVACTAAKTNDDGTCALHSSWGEPADSPHGGSWYHCDRGRERLLDCLPDDAEHIATGAFASTFAELLHRVRQSLVKVAREMEFPGDLDTDREDWAVFARLPAHAQEGLLKYGAGVHYEVAHKRTLEHALLARARSLFVPERQELVKRLCIQLGYIRAEDMEHVGCEPADLEHDPVELFKGFSEVIGCRRRYDALFDERGECDIYRRNFFSNGMHNATHGMRNKMCRVLKETAATLEGDTDRELLVDLAKHVWNLYDIHTLAEVRIPHDEMWSALRAAWGEDNYWFSTQEVEFIMALTGTPVAIYQLAPSQTQAGDALGFFEEQRSWLALPRHLPTVPGFRRIVYFGGKRGHFSRLLSDGEEWIARRQTEKVLMAGREAEQQRAAEDERRQKERKRMLEEDGQSSKQRDSAQRQEDAEAERQRRVETQNAEERPQQEERKRLIEEGMQDINKDDVDMSVPDGNMDDDGGSSLGGSQGHKSAAGSECGDAGTGAGGDDPFKSKSSGSSKQSTPAASEPGDDVMSELSDDYDVFGASVYTKRSWQTTEDVDLMIAECIKEQLRPSPLVPTDDSARGQRGWSSFHCAFKDCGWQSSAAPSGCLEEHIIYEHFIADDGKTIIGRDTSKWRELLNDIAKAVGYTAKELLQYLDERGGQDRRMYTCAAGWNFYTTRVLHYRTLLDYYTRALQLREETKMAEVGYDMDRRTLGIFSHYGSDTQVHSLVCFVCAQIHTDTTGSAHAKGQPYTLDYHDVWKGHWYPERLKQRTEIRYYSVDQSLLTWRANHPDSFTSCMTRAAYDSLYSRDKPLPGEAWTRTVRTKRAGKEEGEEALLCCPEDEEESAANRTDGVLSGDARIPICTECIEQFPLDGKHRRGVPSIPMALGHDNYWGFSTDLIVRYRVRWIEMAAILPMWTHMIVYYVEGHEGHMSEPI